jgi:glycosyltransferase involved in cell wall biosynthesis
MSPANKIKLFIDAHVFDGEFQGSRTFLKEIYSILSAKEDIHLYLGAYNTGNLRKYFPAAKNISFIKYRSTSGFIRLIYDIPSIIKRYGIHYAHFQYIVPVIKNCRFIVTTHDVLFNEYPKEFPFLYRLVKNFLFRTGAKKANILTTVSSYSKRSIQKYFGIKAEDIHIVPNGISNLFFTDYDKTKAKNYIKSKFGVEKFILFVSRLEPRKNHILLVQAFLDLKLYERGYNLVLLGHKSIKTPAFDVLMRNLPEASKPFIFMNSNTDDTDLLEFYRAAEVFVYPSMAEGFGIPPLEAAAVKIPVLCSNTSAMSDFVFFREDHFDPGNYSLFKKKLADVVNTPPDISKLENRGAIVRQNYSWERSAEALYRLIKTDCDQKPERIYAGTPELLKEKK